jgi:hypothetical protein
MRLGQELITNGDFQTDVSGWTVGASGVLTWVSTGVASFQRVVNSGDRFHQFVTVESGKSYLLTLELPVGTATVNVRIGNTLGGSQYPSVDFTASHLQTGLFGGHVLVAPLTENLSLSFSFTSQSTASFSNISFKEILPERSNGFIY